MVTKGMFWKRFYFVVILLSRNCFLLCSNWFCEFVKKLCCCGQPEQNSHGNIEEQVGNLDNNINNNNNLGDTVDEDEDKKKENYTVYKLVFLSSTTCVGKTAILRYSQNQKFVKEYQKTIGAEFFSLQYNNVTTTVNFKLQMWDCSADGKYNNQLIECYTRKASAIVFVYDITNRESFDNLQGYITGVKEEAPEGCLFFLLGNKLDLVEQNQNLKERKVTIDDAKKFAAENNLIFLGECSARTNTYMPVAKNTCYKKENLAYGNCPDGVMGIFKDILSNINVKQKSQGE